MLTVDEARGAMDFGAHYQLTGKKDVDMKLLGNAVAPSVSRAVVGALVSVVSR
jgi:hypothetical protein